MVKQHTQTVQKNAFKHYTVKRINNNRYQVDSQKNQMRYTVTKTLKSDVWTCQCYDFIDRLRSGNDDKRCSHILYVHEFLHGSQDVTSNFKKPMLEIPSICVYCSSTKIVKKGFRKTKYRGKLQIYGCKDCDRKFTNSESGFAKVKFEPSMISEALNLIMSGMSLRNTAEHLSNVRGIRISHVTIGYWIKKYSITIKEYVDTLKPTIGNAWSVDEKMINVRKTEPISKKGYYNWLWSAIDPKTRFLLATKISNEISANLKVRRGLDNDDSSQIYADLLRIHHNFVRPHMGLEGKTPAFVAGLDNVDISKKYQSHKCSCL